jgi:hypothetical protein
MQSSIYFFFTMHSLSIFFYHALLIDIVLHGRRREIADDCVLSSSVMATGTIKLKAYDAGCGYWNSFFPHGYYTRSCGDGRRLFKFHTSR